MKVKLILISILVVVTLAMILPATATAKGVGGATVWDAKLKQTNAPYVFGNLHLVLQRRSTRLIVQLHVFGIRDNQAHTVAITGLSNGASARLPNMSDDTNHDGLISGAEAAVAVGDPLVWLTPIKVKRNGRIMFHATLRYPELAPLDPIDIMLGKCAIVVYGVLQQPAYALPFYDPTAPAACGLIKAKRVL